MESSDAWIILQRNILEFLEEHLCLEDEMETGLRVLDDFDAARRDILLRLHDTRANKDGEISEFYVGGIWKRRPTKCRFDIPKREREREEGLTLTYPLERD